MGFMGINTKKNRRARDEDDSTCSINIGDDDEYGTESSGLDFSTLQDSDVFSFTSSSIDLLGEPEPNHETSKSRSCSTSAMQQPSTMKESRRHSLDTVNATTIYGSFMPSNTDDECPNSAPATYQRRTFSLAADKTESDDKNHDSFGSFSTDTSEEFLTDFDLADDDLADDDLADDFEDGFGFVQDNPSEPESPDLRRKVYSAQDTNTPLQLPLLETQKSLKISTPKSDSKRIFAQAPFASAGANECKRGSIAMSTLSFSTCPFEESRGGALGASPRDASQKKVVLREEFIRRQKQNATNVSDQNANSNFVETICKGRPMRSSRRGSVRLGKTLETSLLGDSDKDFFSNRKSVISLDSGGTGTTTTMTTDSELMELLDYEYSEEEEFLFGNDEDEEIISPSRRCSATGDTVIEPPCRGGTIGGRPVESPRHRGNRRRSNNSGVQKRHSQSSRKYDEADFEKSDRRRRSYDGYEPKKERESRRSQYGNRRHSSYGEEYPRGMPERKPRPGTRRPQSKTCNEEGVRGEQRHERQGSKPVKSRREKRGDNRRSEALSDEEKEKERQGRRNRGERNKSSSRDEDKMHRRRSVEKKSSRKSGDDDRRGGRDRRVSRSGSIDAYSSGEDDDAAERHRHHGQSRHRNEPSRRQRSMSRTRDESTSRRDSRGTRAR